MYKRQVYSIDRFLSKCLDENPQLKNYNMLSVKKTTFSKVNLNDPFFDSLKNDYLGFQKWFIKKYDEEAYVCSTNDSIYGFFIQKLIRILIIFSNVVKCRYNLYLRAFPMFSFRKIHCISWHIHV